MAGRRLLCLGFGYVARALAPRLAARGWRVAGTIRRADAAAALEEGGVESVLWTEEGIEPGAFDGVVAVLISTPPGVNGCPALAAARDRIAARAGAVRWIGYLSSNGVYGDHGGAVIDETTAPAPTSLRAKRRLDSEREWRDFAAAFALPLVIFRLPGIYGPGRSALDAVRDGRAQRIVKQGQVFNRMHVDDIAAALAASLADPGAGALFNLADDEPAPPPDVIEYACKLLGLAPPPLVPIEDAALSDMARSFYADNKRVSNRLMKDRLRPRLSYPTYREGLAAILAGERETAGGPE